MESLQYQQDLLMAMNEKIASTERMYRKICDASSNAYIYFDLEKHTVEIVGDWDHFFSLPIKSEKDFITLFESIKKEFHNDLQVAFFPEKLGKTLQIQECMHEEKKMWIEFLISVSLNENGEPIEKVVQLKDITRVKMQKEELEYLAYFDSLTGLYNRNYFVNRFNEFIKNAELSNDVVSIMFIDIDDFRRINDGMGLIIGDEVVQVFAQYLKDFQSKEVLVSHFSSDIFCIAIYAPCGAKSPDVIAKEIHSRVEETFLLSNRMEIRITVSIGIAEYPEAGNTALELINCAEIVMLRAKLVGKNTTQYFDAPILNEFLQTVSIDRKLKNALLEKGFSLCFQPQYESKSEKLRGVEALLRWKDLDGVNISPTLFIPIAEKNGTIIPIGDWVIEESIQTFAQWRKKFDYSLILSINISTIQYKRMDFVQKLVGILQKYEINPQEIELEITESVLIDDFQDVIEKMHQLREVGIRVSLDDFGTGYSSLSYLKGLPIDTLKIDKSFIDTVTSDDTTKIIMESIIKMVRKLGFETVAEGVETKEQFEYLKTIHCDNIQGFLLGKPMCAKEIELLLMKSI